MPQTLVQKVHAKDAEWTKIVAMDCEMVGVGFKGNDSIVGRVAIVNQFGQCIYDEFVQPTEEVTDYRTAVSGLTPNDLARGKEFSVVQKDVADIVKGRTLVGHSIKQDLRVLRISHARHLIRDTSSYKPFRELFDGKTPALKKLAEKLLGISIQTGAHNPVQDAQTCMRLYTAHRQEWEERRENRRKSRLGNMKRLKKKKARSNPVEKKLG